MWFMVLLICPILQCWIHKYQTFPYFYLKSFFVFLLTISIFLFINTHLFFICFIIGAVSIYDAFVTKFPSFFSLVLCCV
jgi:hypothetical protein